MQRKGMPPKKATTARPSPPAEKPLRQAVQRAERASMNMKSRLNCPAQPIRAMSPKKAGKRFSP